jgi:predicted RNA-binding Zn-ribbon protein involved in translation (DUF1610 family)
MLAMPAATATTTPNSQSSESVRLRERFGVELKGRRNRERLAVYGFAGLVGFGLFAKAAPSPVDKWLMVPMFLSAGFMLFMSFPPNLHCPSCGEDLENDAGRFCPECGAESVSPPTWLGYRKCTACQQALSGIRRHKIHACTHCGFWLDDEGF